MTFKPSHPPQALLRRARLIRAGASGWMEMQRRLFPANPDRFPRASLQTRTRSEEHTSELQSLMRISYAVFCLKKKKKKNIKTDNDNYKEMLSNKREYTEKASTPLGASDDNHKQDQRPMQ